MAFKARRNAEGDYTPDAAAASYPAWTGTAAAPKPSGKAVSIMGLVEGWWAEAKTTGLTYGTYEAYTRAFSMFVAFLGGEDDARAVTPEDVIAFKDHRLAEINPKTGKLISAKTVKDSDLSALKSVFGWAKRNRRVDANPVTDITIKLGTKTQTRGLKGFTDAEATALLLAAATVQLWIPAGNRVPPIPRYFGLIDFGFCL